MFDSEMTTIIVSDWLTIGRQKKLAEPTNEQALNNAFRKRNRNRKVSSYKWCFMNAAHSRWPKPYLVLTLPDKYMHPNLHCLCILVLNKLRIPKIGDSSVHTPYYFWPYTLKKKNLVGLSREIFDRWERRHFDIFHFICRRIHFGNNNVFMILIFLS